MSEHGGKRPGAGRPKGARDVATREAGATIAELARTHADTALDVLVQIAQQSESDAARVSACNAILDRGYGKPSQALELSNPDGTLAPREPRYGLIDKDGDSTSA